MNAARATPDLAGPLLLVDANCLAYQALYTTGGLTHLDQPTGVIFGFLSRLFRLSLDLGSSRYLFFWDSREKGLRKGIYPDYKGNRLVLSEEKKEVLLAAFHQFEALHTVVLPYLGLRSVSEAGYEADDLIAAFAYANPGVRKVVVSADTDLWQVLRPNTVWYNPSSGRRLTATGLRMEEGVRSPADWVEIKALAGCASDNVPGLPGVGEKTAKKLLYGGLPDTPRAGELRSLAGSSRELLARNRRLVRLPFPGTPEPFSDLGRADAEAWAPPFDIEDRFRATCDQFGFASLAERAEDWGRVARGEPPENPSLISPKNEVKRTVREAVRRRMDVRKRK